MQTNKNQNENKQNQTKKESPIRKINLPKKI